MLKGFWLYSLLILIGGGGASRAETSHLEKNHVVPFVNGGITVSGNDPISRSTVMLETDRQYCSATIIGEGLLLTAAHCIGEGDTWVLIHFSGLEGVIHRMATRFLVHEKYRDILGSDERHDIALVFFAGGLPLGFTPVALLPASENLEAGESLYLAGYGDGGPLGTLSKISLTVTDFINTNSLIRFNQSPQNGICHGDSGGPAYKLIKDQLFLVGVASYAHEIDCSGYSVYTRANYYSEWIQKNQ